MPRRLKDKTTKWQGDCKGRGGRMGKSENEKKRESAGIQIIKNEKCGGFKIYRK